MKQLFKQVWVLLFVIFLVPKIFLFSADENFEFISLEHGITQSYVYDIIQDEKGFLWLATADGLNRFDGYNFLPYKHNRSDSTTISDNIIHSIDIDQEGKLYLGAKGLNIFDPYAENVHVKHLTSHNNIDDDVLDVCIRENGQIWIATYNGAKQYLPEKDTLIAYVYNKNKSNSISNDRINSIYEDNSHTLWIATENGLNKYLDDKDAFESYHIKKGRGYDNILKVYEDDEGRFWCIASQIVCFFDRTKARFIMPDKGVFDEKYITSVFQDHTGQIWLGSLNRGIYNFSVPGNAKPDEIFNKIENAFKQKHLDNYNILCFYETEEEILWIGTDNGFIKYDHHRKPFHTYQLPEEFIPGRHHLMVNSILEDYQNRLWIGTQKEGLYYTQGKQLKKFTQNDHEFYPNRVVLDLCEDSKNNIWIGSIGLYQVTENRDDVRRYFPNDKDSINMNGWLVRKVCEDHDQHIWVGTNMGLHRLDKEKGKFVYYAPFPKKDKHKNIVWDIFEDSEKNFWVAFSGYLTTFDRKNEKFKIFKADEDDRSNPNCNSVKCIYEDTKGNIWFGTEGGGLNRYDIKTKEFSYYTMEDGLPSNNVYGILEDDQHNIWISTTVGLAKYNPENDICWNFRRSYGLQSNEFRIGASCLTEDGKMFFGGATGLNYFDPDSIRQNPFQSETRIASIKIANEKIVPGKRYFGKVVLKNAAPYAKKMLLPHKANVFTINFIGIHYSSPQRIKYAYKLEGFNDNWIETTAQDRAVTYTNLDPGIYNFFVRSTNSDGIWSDETAKIRIRVLPPFWRTFWAIIIYVVVIACIVFFIMRAYYSRLRLKKIKEKSKLHNEKIKFFTNISHELRNPLTLILARVDKLNELSKELNRQDIKRHVYLVKKNSQHLLKLVNQLLDFRKLESGKMKLYLQPKDLTAFIKENIEVFTDYAELKSQDIQVDCPQHLYTNFDPDKMEKIIFNLLSNAIKYTPENGKISVSLSIKESSNISIKSYSPQSKNHIQHVLKNNKQLVELEILDNGIGIPGEELMNIFEQYYTINKKDHQSGKGTGIGLALTRELVQVHNGFIFVESNTDRNNAMNDFQGTLFSVYFPYIDVEANDEIIPENKANNEEAGKMQNNNNKPLFTDIEGNIQRYDRNTLLIIEDNKDVRAFIKECFLEDFKVIEAGDGREGIDKAMANLPDLIISDVMMPGVDGIDLCTELKKDEKTSHIPIILITARASEEYKLKGLETGADDYLVKPYNEQVLQYRVKNLIQSRVRLQEKYKGEIWLRPADIKIDSSDEKFIKKIIGTIEDNISDPFFNVDSLEKEVGLSHMQLYRKLKALIGQSANELIRTLRLKRATVLLKKGMSVSEVAYEVGFNDPKYFSKCFKEQFGQVPNEFAQEQSKNT